MESNIKEKDLNEKECPYCGGAIEFTINDKEIKCPYCNKTINVSMYNPDTIIKTENKYYDIKGKTQMYYKGNLIERKDFIVLIIVIFLVIVGLIFLGINLVKKHEVSSKYEEISNKNIDYVFIDELHKRSKKLIEEEASKLTDFHITSIDRYKSYIYNTQTINNQGYSKDNDLFDIYKVTYSSSSDQFDVYQCVSHSGIIVKESIVSFDEDDPTYFLKKMNSGIMYTGSFDEFKMELNNNEYIYGSRSFDELYNNIVERKNWDKWDYYSIIEIDG